MSYNSSLPADTTAHEEIRENFRALKEDKIVAANTATTLETARTINGVSFDGSADIVITQVDGKDIATVDQIITTIPTQNDTGWFSVTGGSSYPITFPFTSEWYVKSFKCRYDNYEFDYQTNQYGDANQYNGAHINIVSNTEAVVTTEKNIIHGVYLWNKSTGVREAVNSITSAEFRIVFESLN